MGSHETTSLIAVIVLSFMLELLVLSGKNPV